jgi:hypothetical protein
MDLHWRICRLHAHMCIHTHLQLARNTDLVSIKYPLHCWSDRNVVPSVVINVDGIDLAQNRDQWWALMNMVMNLWVL